MQLSPLQIEDLVKANAEVLALPIAPAHLPGVLAYIALAAHMAELVNGLALDASDESGSVFIPVAPVSRDETR